MIVLLREDATTEALEELRASLEGLRKEVAEARTEADAVEAPGGRAAAYEAAVEPETKGIAALQAGAELGPQVGPRGEHRGPVPRHIERS